MVEVKQFTIGELAARVGVATSAVRFYEEHGLITGTRATSGHRRYNAEVVRRVSFIKVAQQVGLSLAEIRTALDSLPQSRTPTRADWSKLADSWRPMLDARIALLKSLRNQLDSCIGCGCLSLDTCGLYNPDDNAQHHGPGPRYLLGNRPRRR